MNSAKYKDKFSEHGFFNTLRKYRNKIPFIHDALAMFYCMMDPKTPAWVKGLIVGALGYFICPVDAIPDFLVPVGFADDGAVIAGVMVTIDIHITDEHRRKADAWLNNH